MRNVILFLSVFVMATMAEATILVKKKSQISVGLSYLGNAYDPFNTNSFSMALPAGKLVMMVGAVSVDGATLTVGGSPATTLGSNYTTVSRGVEAFEYDNPTAGTYTITVDFTGPNRLDSIVHVYSVENSGSIAFSTNTLPKASSSTGAIIFMSQTANAPSGIPSATSALTVDYNADIRSGENNYTAHALGATTLSDDASLAANVSYITLIVSK